MPTLLFAFFVLHAQAEVAKDSTGLPAGKDLLDEQYVDGSFGFALRPPAGCTVYREKRFVETDELELAKFVDLGRRWSLAVRLSDPSSPFEVKAITQAFTSNLASKFGDIQVIREEQVKIGSREAIRYAATFMAEQIAWFHQHAVIRTQPNEYYNLVFITPLNDQELAGNLFDRIVDGFKVLRSEPAQERIHAALERGRDILQKVSSGKINLTERVVADSYMRFFQNGKEIGFIQTKEQAGDVDHRKGIEIRQWCWLFKDDESTTLMQQYMFLAGDLSYEKWENRVWILPAAKPDAPRRAILDVENGIRQGNKLLIAFTPTPNAPEKREKVIQVDKSYAPEAWYVLLPRLLDLNTPETYAFSSYKSDRRGLVLRTFGVLGPTSAMIAGRDTPAIKLEDSEGLIPPVSEIIVDKSGSILRVLAGPVEMAATTREYVELHYKARVADAMKLAKNYPVPEPAPPRRAPPTPAGNQNSPDL